MKGLFGWRNMIAGGVALLYALYIFERIDISRVPPELLSDVLDGYGSTVFNLGILLGTLIVGRGLNKKWENGKNGD